MKIVPQSVTVLDYTGHAVQRIEVAGRTCYKSENKLTQGSAEKFVRMIINRGHDSVLEHAYMSCRIITDRGISHEIVRHRIGCSYSQESTRYCNYGKVNDITFIQPLGLKKKDVEWWSNIMKDIEGEYCELIAHGYPPQVARSVLPNCLKTEIVMTANFRAWRHFLKLRCASGAHPQIQEIANMVKNWFIKVYPVIVEDL